MGQYYKPCIVDSKNKKTVKAWMYSHEYDNGLKLMEHSWIKNKFVGAFESLIKGKPQRVVWAGDYAGPIKGAKTNTYSQCKELTKVNPEATVVTAKYIVNHDKKVFVDKTKVPDKDGWQIHPLPLLTCEGNGQGGGDFFDVDKKKLVGSWARDVISVESEKPKGFKEIKFDLIEMG